MQAQDNTRPEAGQRAGASTPEQAREVAAQLNVALSRVQARIRQDGGTSGEGLTPSQVAMLERLAERGSLSVTQLAEAEHVSQQAITQRLALLRPTGFVQAEADPGDARRKLVTITEDGRRALAHVVGAEKTWLASTLAASMSAREIEILGEAAELLERLASSGAR